MPDQAYQPTAEMIDPQTLMRIKSLELRARTIVEGFWSGMHRSPYHGFSVEFTEYRQYTVGDDPRYIDWKLYARTDRAYIKRFEDETNLRCHLLVDNSQSMGFGSLGYTKEKYASTLAATLAYFMSTQRDAVGLVTFDEQLREYVPAKYRPGHLRRLMVALERPVEGSSTNLTEPIRRIADLATKRGLFVFISDLLAPLDGLEQHLGYLRSRGHEVFVIHLLDPAELTLDFDAPAMFHDPESGKDIYVDPHLIRDKYQGRLQEHIAKVEQSCEKLGAEYTRFTTDQPLELALFDFLCSRMHLKRAVLRRQTMRAGQ